MPLEAESGVASLRLCEICGVPGEHLVYKGRFLCSRCTLLGCESCWGAVTVTRDGFWSMWWRWVCPNCGAKGKRHWWWQD